MLTLQQHNIFVLEYWLDFHLFDMQLLFDFFLIYYTYRIIVTYNFSICGISENCAIYVCNFLVFSANILGDQL